MNRATLDEYLAATADIKQNDLESEKYAIAGIISGNSIQISDLLSKLTPNDFTDAAFRKVFEIAKAEWDAGEMGEGLEKSIMFHSRHREVLDNLPWNVKTGIGSYSDLVGLMFPHDLAKNTIRHLRRKTEARDLLEGLYTAIDLIRYTDDASNDTVYAYLQDLVNGHVSEEQEEQELTQDEFGDGILQVVIDAIDEKKRKKNRVNTNWPNFQKNTGGMEVENLVIVSAPTGKGKSALSLNIATNVGVTQNQPTLYINSELSDAQMQERMAAHMAFLDANKIRSGEYGENGVLAADVQRMLEGAKEFYKKASLRFKKIPNLQIGDVEAAVRRDKAERDTKLVVVDYVGRMDFEKSAKRDLQEWQYLRLMALRLKSIAQQNHVCIIMVAQLTAEGTLQGSKAMANECDMWLNLKRLDGEQELDKNFPYNAKLEVRKARMAPDGKAINFRFDGAFMRFSDSASGIKDLVDKNREYGKYATQIFTDGEYQRLSDIARHEERKYRK